MKVEDKSGKTTTVFIDHHGSGRREPTSATKMVYDILEKGDLLKEKQPWLKDCVNFVNEIDNLSYVDRKNDKGEKIFDNKFFMYKWPRTPYALAGEMPIEQVIELFKSGKIKDGMEPFTRNEISNGEIGKIEVKGIDFNGKIINKTIKEVAIEKQKQAIFNSSAIGRSKKYADMNELNMNMKSFQGKDVEMIFHDFPKIVNAKGKEYPNRFVNNMAYLSAKAQGYGGIIVWNPKKMDKRFFVNIDSPEMERIGKELNKVAPGTTEVRGAFIFSPKDPESARALTKEQFLNIISPNILKEATIIKTGIEKNKGEGKLILNKEEEKEAVEEEKIENIKELIDEENKEEQLETKEGDAVDTKELAKKGIKENPELAQKEAKDKIEKSIKNVADEKERELRKDHEAGLEKKLEEAREKYAIAYKKFMAERKEKTGFFTRMKRKVFGETVPDEEVPEDLKKLENDYTKAAAVLGQGMYLNMAKELSLSDLPEENRKNLLEHFKQSQVFNKVVIEEEEKLTALKAENLPPKEKGIFRKCFDLYQKQNRFTKVAISTVLSTAVIATFIPSMMVAGGVTAGYLATKFGRGVVGGIFGQLAAKGYDMAVKEKYTERKEIALEELKKKFGDKMSEEDLLKYKKEYAEILEKERVSKRNRLIHKAGIAIVAGGLAAIETGHLAQSFSTPAVPTDMPVIPKTISPEHLFKTEEVQFSSKGAIQTIQNLKTKISADYPDLSKAPHSVQEFMKTNSTQEAIKLGFYNPNSASESAMILKGSTLGFDEHGNLSYHDIKTGETHNLIQEQNNTESIEKYHEKMFDSDHSGNPNSHPGINGEHPVKIDGASGDLTGEHPTNINGAADNLTGQNPTNINGAAENLSGKPAVNIDGAANDTTGGGQNPTNINGAADQINPDNNQGGTNLDNTNVSELTKIAHNTYESNINKIFPGQEELNAWNTIRNSVKLHPAEQFLSWEGPIAEQYAGLLKHMQTLEDVTHLEPTVPNSIPPIPLSVEQYITNATQKAVEMGPESLEKIKVKM
ncbi:MAG: hypothetical protein WCG45_03465 [bacterium]